MKITTTADGKTTVTSPSLYAVAGTIIAPGVAALFLFFGLLIVVCIPAVPFILYRQRQKEICNGGQ